MSCVGGELELTLRLLKVLVVVVVTLSGGLNLSSSYGLVSGIIVSGLIEACSIKVEEGYSGWVVNYWVMVASAFAVHWWALSIIEF